MLHLKLNPWFFLSWGKRFLFRRITTRWMMNDDDANAKAEIELSHSRCKIPALKIDGFNMLIKWIRSASPVMQFLVWTMNLDEMFKSSNKWGIMRRVASPFSASLKMPNTNSYFKERIANHELQKLTGLSRHGHLELGLWFFSLVPRL